MKLMPTVTQGVPATKAFYPISKAKQPQVSNVTADEGAPPIPGATGGGAQSLPGSIDLQAFFAAWGTDNEQFDVTKDGTVDAQDLSVFLGSAEQALIGQASPDQVIGSWGQPSGGGDVNGDGLVDGFDLALSLGNVTPPKEVTLAEGVQKAWGSNDTSYDLNKDGNVDGVDLALALGGQATSQNLSGGDAANPATSTATAETEGATATQAASQATGQAAEVAAKLTDAVLQAKDQDNDGSLTAAELKSSSALLGRADLDGDKAISRDELQARLTSEFARASTKPEPDFNRVTSKWAQALLRTDSASVQARNAYASGANSVTNKLYQKLAASGFAQTPPSNLSKLVQGLGMNDRDRASVMRGLANRYPKGLGVSAQA